METPEIQGLIIIVVFATTIVYMKMAKRQVPEGQIVQDALTGSQKALIWVLCILNPVIAGSIFYYGWKKKLPVKAKQANSISLWIFFIQILLVGGLAFAGVI